MNNSLDIIKTIKNTIEFSFESSDIYIHEPSFIGSNAYKYVKECIDTGWVSSAGAWVSKFEKKISLFAHIV